MLTFDQAVLTAPLVSMADSLISKHASHESSNGSMLHSNCVHEEASRESLFISKDTTSKNFIAQSICYMHRKSFGEHLPHNISNEIVNFVKERKELKSNFTSSCLQAFNERKQRSRNIHYQLFGYSAIFAFRRKETHKGMKSPMLKQIK